MSKGHFSEKTKYEIWYRDKERCVLCGGKQISSAPHHCFWKSQYFKEDRNEAWNGVLLCMRCDFALHHQGARNKQEECMKMALNRYEGKYKEELLKIMRAKGFLSKPEAGLL